LNIRAGRREYEWDYERRLREKRDCEKMLGKSKWNELEGKSEVEMRRREKGTL